jgi:hypothetical protein
MFKFFIRAFVQHLFQARAKSVRHGLPVPVPWFSRLEQGVATHLAEGVDIGIWSWPDALQLTHLFRRGVLNRTCHAIAENGVSHHTCRHAGFNGLLRQGQAEVDDLHTPQVAFLANQHVVRLQIPVEDVFLVRSLHSLSNLPSNSDYGLWRNCATLLHKCLQANTREVVHDDVRMGHPGQVSITAISHSDYGGMLQLAENLGFPKHISHVSFKGRIMQSFDNDLGIKKVVTAQEGSAEPTCA